MGFVGRHLARELLRERHDVVAADIPGANSLGLPERGTAFIEFDVTNRESARRAILEAQPDAVVHLAGIAHVVEASSDRGRLLDVTVGGTENLCLAVSEIGALATPVLFASSSLVYEGLSGEPLSVSEENEPRPASAYGHAKLAAEHVLMSFASHNLRPYIIRPFNHIGPGQAASFVCSGFARRIALAFDGDEIDVGNLSARRDFSDVRDIARGYRLILEKKPELSLFVLGRGSTVSIQEVFDGLVKLSGKRAAARAKPQLMRGRDNAELCADIRRARRELGWDCEIPLEESLHDIYCDAMEQVSKRGG